MEPNVPLEKLADEVLAGIGRNVLLFQQVELNLKVLLANGYASGNIRDLLADREQRIASISKMTLGTLVEHFSANILSGSEAATNLPVESEGLWMSFKFKVDPDASRSEKLQKSLESLVVERNELIHHSLVSLARYRHRFKNRFRVLTDPEGISSRHLVMSSASESTPTRRIRCGSDRKQIHRERH